jgi:hypothetical protein
MANTTQPVDAPIRDGKFVPIALAAVSVFKGGAAAVVEGVGYGTPLVAASTGTQQFVGVFTETYNNSGGTAGGYFTTLLRTGLIQWAQTGTTITAANIGQNAYFADDHTVTLSPGTQYAGEITTVDANGNVWVDISNATLPYTASGPIVINTLAPAVTITNVAGAAQVFASFAIPANVLQIGDRIRVRGQIVGVTRTASDTTALSLVANTTNSASGGTSLFTLASAFAHATTNFLYFDTELVVQTIGATGTILGGGIVNGGTAGATTTGLYVGSTTVATNAPLYIVLSGTFSASNTTDQAAVDIYDLDVTRV